MVVGTANVRGKTSRRYDVISLRQGPCLHLWDAHTTGTSTALESRRVVARCTACHDEWRSFEGAMTKTKWKDKCQK